MEDKAKQYVFERKIPLLFESLMTGLMVHRPLDHIGFIIDCLKQLRQTEDLNWDTFIRDDFTDRTRSERRSARGSRPSSSTFRDERPPSLRKCATLPPVRNQKAVPNLGEEKRPGSKSYSRQRPLPSISSISAKREVNNTTCNVVFVLGGPGSGKGTQCARVVSEFNFAHLSTGDLLRGEVEKGSPLGREVEETMRQGKLVPSRTIVSLLRQAMENRTNVPGFLLDGFPRELEQAELFEKEVGPCTKVVMFECSEEVMTRRLLQRGEFSGRADDNEETIKKRLVTFREETLPVIQHYSKQDKVVKINAERDVDEVFRDVYPVFRRLTFRKKYYHNVVFVLGGPGSGKGTHCARVVSEFNFAHLSTGDLLRGEVEKGSPLGREVEETMRQGKLVPSRTIATLLRSALEEKEGSQGFLIDGFPRELEQAHIFEEEVCECTKVVMFECSEEVMTRRLLQRGEFSGRADDNEETIKKRLVTFREETLPVIQHYSKQDKVVKINSDRQVDDVYQDVRTVFKQLVRPPSSLAGSLGKQARLAQGLSKGQDSSHYSLLIAYWEGITGQSIKLRN